GPDGPTVVQVDDGSGEPTTCTLGKQDGEGEASLNATDTDARQMAAAVGDDFDTAADSGNGESPDTDGGDSGENRADDQPAADRPGGDSQQDVETEESAQSAETAGGAGAASQGLEAAAADGAGATESSFGDTSGAGDAAADTGSDTAAAEPDTNESSAEDSADGPETNTATSAQGWLGDVLDGELGFDDAGADETQGSATSEIGDQPAGAASGDSGSDGSAILGTAPGGEDTADTDTETDNDSEGRSGGAGRGMGGMMGGAGAGNSGGE